MKAERETTDRLIANFLADRIGATFEGRVSGVTRAGLFVKLNETGADGFVPARVIGKPDLGRLDIGLPADLVVLDDNLEIERVCVGGEDRVVA